MGHRALTRIQHLPSNTVIQYCGCMLGLSYGCALWAQVGRIKQKRGYKDQWPHAVKLYADESGKNKGDAVLTYEDPQAAHSAGGFFNGTPRAFPSGPSLSLQNPFLSALHSPFFPSSSFVPPFPFSCLLSAKASPAPIQQAGSSFATSLRVFKKEGGLAAMNRNVLCGAVLLG